MMYCLHVYIWKREYYSLAIQVGINCLTCPLLVTLHNCNLLSLSLSLSISVVQACSQCLPRVLASKNAAALLSKMEDMYEWTTFLQPFKSTKKGVRMFSPLVNDYKGLFALSL